MNTKILLFLVSGLGFVACGIPKDEHQKTLDQLAQTQQNLTQSKKTIATLNQRNQALEAQNKKLGGDLSNVEENFNKTSADLAATKSELENLRHQRELAEKRMKTFRELAARLKAMVDSGKLQVQIRKGRMVLRLPDNVLFPAGSATLKKQGQQTLETVAAALHDVDRDFQVGGHTDNTPIRTPRFPSNWELSTQRAVEVVKYLATNGLNPAHLSAAGFADTDPIAPNDTPENKQQNRRIEIIVLPNIEELPKLDDQG